MTNVAFLKSMAKRGEKIAMLTCYDATFAKLMEAAGVDVLLVGDSLGMVMQGKSSTLEVTMEDMEYHTRSVSNGVTRTMIITDMPFGSYENDLDVALKNARRLMAAGAHMVKLEGGGPMVDTARYLVENDIPVCAHLGFTPQSVNKLGGYRIQGKTEESARQILDDARRMGEAGVDFVLLEMVPAALAKQITDSIGTPTIGIGAGTDCNGQVLVLQDLLGIYTGPADKDPHEFKSPRFVRNFLEHAGNIQQAVSNYVKAVKEGSFPSSEHCY